MKIGLGIVTCNRPEWFKKVFNSIDKTKIDHLVVVNDGTPYENFPENIHCIQHEKNQGVAKSKNDAFKYLLERKCDYFFIQEDDILILNNDIFQQYIDLYKITGIEHFNFSMHGPANKDFQSGNPNPRYSINYNTTKLILNLHIIGAFSFYTRNCLEKVGLFDEQFLNAADHVDHSYRIIKAGLHPPFWYFADLYNSWTYLQEIEFNIKSSVIRQDPKFQEYIKNADDLYIKKWGFRPPQTPMVPIQEVFQYLKNVKGKVDNDKIL